MWKQNGWIFSFQFLFFSWFWLSGTVGYSVWCGIDSSQLKVLIFFGNDKFGDKITNVLKCTSWIVFFSFYAYINKIWFQWMDSAVAANLLLAATIGVFVLLTLLAFLMNEGRPLCVQPITLRIKRKLNSKRNTAASEVVFFEANGGTVHGKEEDEEVLWRTNWYCVMYLAFMWLLRCNRNCNSIRVRQFSANIRV